MLMNRRYRDRAVGLLGALAFLLAGVLASGATERRPANGAAAHTSALESRPEIVC